MDEDVLISRVVDGRAAPEDWAGLRRLAAEDPAVHQRLAAAQEQQCLLVAAVDRLLPETPRGVADNAFTRGRGFPWLSAAAIVIAVLGGFVAGGLFERDRAGDVVSPRRGPPPATVVRDAGGANRLRDLPHVLIDSRPVPGGRGVEVTYLRRTLERAVLESVYSLGSDELGNPVVLPSQMPTSGDF